MQTMNNNMGEKVVPATNANQLDSNRTSMDSSVNSLTEYNLPFHLWIVYEICSIALIIGSLYIFVALLFFTCRKSQLFRNGNIQLQSNSHSDLDWMNNRNSYISRQKKASVKAGMKRRRNSGTGQSAFSLKILCLFGAFFALLRIVSDQLELATYERTRINCKIYQVTVVCIYAVSAAFIYTALWLRLRIFLYHPIMRHLTSSTIIFLIWTALACIIASAILNTSIFVVTVESVDSTQGCVLGNTTSISPTVRYIVLTLSTVTSQGMLLSLFLYPLMQHRSKIKSLSTGKAISVVIKNSCSNMTSSALSRDQLEPDVIKGPIRQGSKMNFEMAKRLRREKRLAAIILRVLITAVVCVISDVMAAVITIVLGDFPRVVSNMVFNFNLLVNLVSVLLSFGDWRKRIFPCCSDPKKRNRTDTITSIALQSNQQEVESNESGPTNPRSIIKSFTISKPPTLNDIFETYKSDEINTSLSREEREP